jgi:hypothetical protein
MSDWLESISIELSIFICLLFSILIALFGSRTEAFMNFLTFFLVQFIILGLFVLIRVKNGLLIGVTLGLALVSAIEVFWELRLNKSPNSMPFFSYFFLCIPSVIGGFTFLSILTVGWREQSFGRSFIVGLVGSTWVIIGFLVWNILRKSVG